MCIMYYRLISFVLNFVTGRHVRIMVATCLFSPLRTIGRSFFGNKTLSSSLNCFVFLILIPFWQTVFWAIKTPIYQRLLKNTKHGKYASLCGFICSVINLRRAFTVILEIPDKQFSSTFSIREVNIVLKLNVLCSEPCKKIKKKLLNIILSFQANKKKKKTPREQ